MPRMTTKLGCAAIFAICVGCRPAAPVSEGPAQPVVDSGSSVPADTRPNLDASIDGGSTAVKSREDSGATEPPNAVGAPAHIDAGLAVQPVPTIRDRCFPGIGDPTKGLPNYDAMAPTVGTHCLGTNHQAIDSIQRVVFLGDSITVGTPPTQGRDFYANRLVAALESRFGSLEVKSCARWGAKTSDLQGGRSPQFDECFRSVETKRTLVVMTVGGNDMVEVAQGHFAGESMSRTLERVDEIVGRLRQAVTWFGQNANRFQNGVFVAFANVYEYTDATGDLPICAMAQVFSGLNQPWTEGRAAYIRLAEGYMNIAVDTRTDMVLLLETFCGHGFHSDNPQNECYRGPNAERWIDFTCIHPTPAGHGEIAKMFLAVIGE